MTKHVRWILVAVVLLGVLATPAWAGGDKCRDRWLGTTFNLVGQVTAIDAQARTLVVQVYSGDAAIVPYIGGQLTVQTDGDTVFVVDGVYKTGVIFFADVEVGTGVSITGRVLVDDGANESFLAKRVTVDVPLQ